MRWCVFRPYAAEHIKGVGCSAADSMVCGSHYELGTGSDLTEPTDHEMVPKLRIIEKYIILFKPSRINRVIVIGVIPN